MLQAIRLQDSGPGAVVDVVDADVVVENTVRDSVVDDVAGRDATTAISRL